MKQSAGSQPGKRWLSLRELSKRRRERWKKRIEEIKVWVRDLVDELRQHGIRVEQVLLFGSYARGDYAESSDIDLIIVSDDWANTSLNERLSILYRIWDKPLDATFIPVTREELEAKIETSVVIRDALKYALEIYP